MRDAPAIDFLLALDDADPALRQRCQEIAAREERLGAARYEPIREALAACYGPAEDGVLLARLAGDIRAGRPLGLALVPLLRRLVEMRLAESNPSFIIDSYDIILI
jgi:hypothetical protein